MSENTSIFADMRRTALKIPTVGDYKVGEKTAYPFGFPLSVVYKLMTQVHSFYCTVYDIAYFTARRANTRRAIYSKRISKHPNALYNIRHVSDGNREMSAVTDGKGLIIDIDFSDLRQKPSTNGVLYYPKFLIHGDVANTQNLHSFTSGDPKEEGLEEHYTAEGGFFVYLPKWAAPENNDSFIQKVSSVEPDNLYRIPLYSDSMAFDNKDVPFARWATCSVADIYEDILEENGKLSGQRRKLHTVNDNPEINNTPNFGFVDEPFSFNYMLGAWDYENNWTKGVPVDQDSYDTYTGLNLAPAKYPLKLVEKVDNNGPDNLSGQSAGYIY